ncbi:MAG: hypothetical protein WAV76_04185 [Bacteroidota bacterium]
MRPGRFNLQDKLFNKIEALNATIWKDHVLTKPIIIGWLDNFNNEKERLHALFLLSRFMYFGSVHIRELLKALYRDLYKYPIIEDIRKTHSNTMDIDIIKREFEDRLHKTKFVGVGGPSESGSMLVYHFRLVNSLSMDSFANQGDLVISVGTTNKEVLKEPQINHYIFIDDFCGSGQQASTYLDDLVAKIKTIDPDITIDYLTLFAMQDGIRKIKLSKKFNRVEAVFEMNISFKCFSHLSRYKDDLPAQIDFTYAKQMCANYGKKLIHSLCQQADKNASPEQLNRCAERNALGFNNDQLLLGFQHNVPDNTLPIIWYNEKIVDWTPIFQRYNKK